MVRVFCFISILIVSAMPARAASPEAINNQLSYDSCMEVQNTDTYNAAPFCSCIDPDKSNTLKSVQKGTKFDKSSRLAAYSKCLDTHMKSFIISKCEAKKEWSHPTSETGLMDCACRYEAVKENYNALWSAAIDGKPLSLNRITALDQRLDGICSKEQ